MHKGATNRDTCAVHKSLKEICTARIMSATSQAIPMIGGTYYRHDMFIVGDDVPCCMLISAFLLQLGQEVGELHLPSLAVLFNSSVFYTSIQTCR